MEMYCIYDRKLREYGSILLSPNPGAMYRTCQVGIKGTNSLMEKYPQDFELHRIGTFNTSTGEIEASGRPEVIALLSDVLEV